MGQFHEGKTRGLFAPEDLEELFEIGLVCLHRGIPAGP
jgi:hypothetical protein